MGKKTPDAPAPPNAGQIAAAQTGINREAAVSQAQLNQVDEFTPYGNSVWKPVGGLTPEGNQRYSRTATLDPAQQAILDQQNAVNLQLNTVAGQQVGRVGETLSTPFTYAGMPQGGDAGNYRQTESNLRAMTQRPYDLQAGKSFAPTAQGIGAAANAGAQAAMRATDSYSQPFDYSSAPAAPGADGAARQQVIDSMYGQAQSRLDPRFESEQVAMENKLANSGIPRGSQAFASAMSNFNLSKNDAYQGAYNSAVQAGGAEQSRLFGIGTEARRNDINERNYLRALPASEQQQLMGMYGQAQQLYQNQFDAMGNVRDREISEELRQRQIPMQEMQNLAAMQQGLFGLDNQQRQRVIQEQAYLRNLPLNETAALMSGTQIQNPQFGAATPTAIAATDYAGLAGNNYANQVNAYNAKLGLDSAKYGAQGDLAAALGTAAIKYGNSGGGG
jgi:hypothetical protein